uniref:Malate dehydrogenase, mitochondrial n=1 Tax=Macrostomum lignano TaxID=282301 RepID=A0A1I8HY15_9PLAT
FCSFPAPHQQQPWPAALSTCSPSAAASSAHRLPRLQGGRACGASGGIGQPLSLLLKQSPLVSQLALYDIQGVKGVAADLSHISTKAEVSGFDGPASLSDCLKGSRVVVIPARADLITAVAKTCPKAMICIVTNPRQLHRAHRSGRSSRSTTHTIPGACLESPRWTLCDPTHLWPRPRAGRVQGERAGDRRAQRRHDHPSDQPGGAQRELQGAGPRDADHAHSERGHRGAVNAKAGAGSATLSMAFAARNSSTPSCRPSTASAARRTSPRRCLLGRDGVEENLGLGNLIEFEAKLLQAAMPELQQNIAKGVKFVKERY